MRITYRPFRALWIFGLCLIAGTVYGFGAAVLVFLVSADIELSRPSPKGVTSFWAPLGLRPFSS